MAQHCTVNFYYFLRSQVILTTTSVTSTCNPQTSAAAASGELILVGGFTTIPENWKADFQKVVASKPHFGGSLKVVQLATIFLCQFESP